MRGRKVPRNQSRTRLRTVRDWNCSHVSKGSSTRPRSPPLPITGPPTPQAFRKPRKPPSRQKWTARASGSVVTPGKRVANSPDSTTSRACRERNSACSAA
jgi:hypothetical protein